MSCLRCEPLTVTLKGRFERIESKTISRINGGFGPNAAHCIVVTEDGERVRVRLSHEAADRIFNDPKALNSVVEITIKVSV